MSINVVNRRGESVPLKLETISRRLVQLAEMHPRLSVSTDIVAVKTVASLIDGIHTRDIDRISANICASLIIDDHEYDDLAARIIISDLHKTTTSSLVTYADALTSYMYRGHEISILHPTVVAFIKMHHQELERAIDYQNDYTNSFFGAVTLIKSYLLSYKYDNDVKVTKERPQQMIMRVAIGINMMDIATDGSATKDTISNIIDTYKLLSNRYYTHATPTLFNAGTVNHTLSSCYLLSIDDSLDNIYSRLTDISKISKFSGGVGVHMSQVRASGSVIASTIGRSEGLVPLMRVFNESTRYVSQGGGKRKGSTAVYLEPWHADIESAILSQKQQGSPERLCRDLFLALWVPDLFMQRVKHAIKTKTDVMWSLMCPNECPGLADTYGAEFETLYLSYESSGRYRKQVSIKKLWDLIMATQIETGKPYLMYKDHANRKCNQNNCGTIKSSNLCSEITIYSDTDNVGVCNLASICLPKFVKRQGDEVVFDYAKLNEVMQSVVVNMNKVIDVNKHVLDQARASDDKNRPIGIGVQGLAEVFMMMRTPFDSNLAIQINKNIFETMYYGALVASNQLAMKYGSYETFSTSMTASGTLQFDLWGVTPSSGMWDWDALRSDIVNNGLRNSLLMAQMPTAGTSIVMNTLSESIEIPQSNIFTRSTLSGRFQVVNKYLMTDLKELGLWTKRIRNKIIEADGSVQSIEEIPRSIRDIYRTVYEYKLTALIRMGADRSAYICQSSSNNRYLPSPDMSLLTNMHLYSWKMGEKTSSYYVRVKQQTTGAKLLDASEDECLSCSA
jgi:ribonucleoside-diphosphate reductase alpha chain